jgi:hypothetical protein
MIVIKVHDSNLYSPVGWGGGSIIFGYHLNVGTEIFRKC